MRNVLMVLSISTLVLLTGCAATAPVVVAKVQYKALTTPAQLLKKCDVTSPPSIKTYLASDDAGKENLLVKHNSALMKDLSVCNAQIREIDAFQTKQLEAVEGINR